MTAHHPKGGFVSGLQIIAFTPIHSKLQGLWLLPWQDCSLLNAPAFADVARLDSKFTAEFCRILDRAGVTVVRISFQAPNMNAVAERCGAFSVKSECLDQIICSANELWRTLSPELVSAHRAKPHQGPLSGQVEAESIWSANHESGRVTTSCTSELDTRGSSSRATELP